MDFRCDPHERQFRIRTLVPPGNEARISRLTTCSSSASRKNTFSPMPRPCEVPAETPDALFQAADFGASGMSAANSYKPRSKSRPNRIARSATREHELRQLRQNAAAAAAEHGLAIFACGTHPLACWRESVQSPKDRYAKVMDDLQMIGQRNMLCGMHVHVEFPIRRAGST